MPCLSNLVWGQLSSGSPLFYVHMDIAQIALDSPPPPFLKRAPYIFHLFFDIANMSCKVHKPSWHVFWPNETAEAFHPPPPPLAMPIWIMESTHFKVWLPLFSNVNIEKVFRDIKKKLFSFRTSKSWWSRIAADSRCSVQTMGSLHYKNFFDQVSYNIDPSSPKGFCASLSLDALASLKTVLDINSRFCHLLSDCLNRAKNIIKAKAKANAKGKASVQACRI